MEKETKKALTKPNPQGDAPFEHAGNITTGDEDVAGEDVK